MLGYCDIKMVDDGQQIELFVNSSTFSPMKSPMILPSSTPYLCL